DVQDTAKLVAEGIEGHTERSWPFHFKLEVLYWNPRIDMTAEVVSRLNSQYKAAGGKSSLGSAKKLDRESALARRASGRE
ncbi:MAG: hypothetical protein IH987_00065, partial [Planctomycetes bacterium]|nr:hypothetical protein [Planctomycetota bacterium]